MARILKQPHGADFSLQPAMAHRPQPNRRQAMPRTNVNANNSANNSATTKGVATVCAYAKQQRSQPLHAGHFVNLTI